MKTATRHEQRQDTARGRFGRDVRNPAPEAAPTADLDTTIPSEAAEPRFQLARYQVDAEAVADAIATRLLAGRALRLRPAPDS